MAVDWQDALIPALYFIFVISIGVHAGRRTGSLDDLFLAGRGLGFGIVGLSLFASNISSTTLVGLSGAAYSSGIAVANYEWMAGVVLLFAALFLVPVYLRNHCRTVPDFLGQRFGSGCRRYVAGVMIALSILVDTAGSLYAGALVLQVFVPGLSLSWTIFALGLVVGVYTAFGGLRAVMLTDALQALVLLLGSSVIAWSMFSLFDFSWVAVKAAVPPEHLSLLRPADSPDMPWTGLISGVPILGLYYWTMNHYITQRFFAARNEDHARWGAVLAALLKLAPLFIMVLPGAMAIAVFPGLERGDQVFPTLVRELLPVGLRGLVLAGLLAAIMSTIDSTLNAASAMVAYDFLHLDEVPARRVRNLTVARLLTFGFMLLAILWAPMIGDFPGLFAYLQQMFAVAAPPVVVVYLAGIFWRGAGGRAALLTLLCGHAAGIALLLASQQRWWSLHFLETAGLVTAACLLLMIVASRFSIGLQPAPGAGCGWQRSMLAMTRRYPPWADYRVQMVLVLLLVAGILISFW